jgi:hypothetical protein
MAQDFLDHKKTWGLGNTFIDANVDFSWCYEWKKVYLVVPLDISCFQLRIFQTILKVSENRHFFQVCGQVKHEKAWSQYILWVGFRTEQVLKWNGIDNATLDSQGIMPASKIHICKQDLVFLLSWKANKNCYVYRSMEVYNSCTVYNIVILCLSRCTCEHTYKSMPIYEHVIISIGTLIT